MKPETHLNPATKKSLTPQEKILYAYHHNWPPIYDSRFNMFESKALQIHDAKTIAAIQEGLKVTARFESYHSLYLLLQTIFAGGDSKCTLSQLVHLSNYSKFLIDIQFIKESYLTPAKEEADSELSEFIDRRTPDLFDDLTSKEYFRQIPKSAGEQRVNQKLKEKISRAVKMSRDHTRQPIRHNPLTIDDLRKKISALIREYNQEHVKVQIEFNISAHDAASSKSEIEKPEQNGIKV